MGIINLWGAPVLYYADGEILRTEVERLLPIGTHKLVKPVGYFRIKKIICNIGSG